MTIEFFDGLITAEQHVVPEEMRVVTIDSLQPGESCLTADNSLWMGPDGKMWLDAKGPRYDVNLVDGDDLDEYVRVLCLPEGLIADISHAREDYLDEVTADIRFPQQTAPIYEVDGYTCEPVPVIGLITSEMELDIFKNIIKKQHGYDYEELSSPTQ